jgi:hypothetical protein
MSDRAENPEQQLLQFPCSITIKAMGVACEEFEWLVVELIRRHAPDLGENAVRSRPSRGGKYLAVSVTVQAQSRDQMDAIYQSLSAHEQVLMAL